MDPGLGQLLRRLVALTDGSTASWYKAAGFDYRPRYTPIMRVLQSGPASMTGLQDKLSVTQGAVSQTIGLMIEDHLIAHRKGKDARQSIVSLSPHGQAVLQELKPHWQATFRAIEALEGEINLPLLQCLRRTVEALEKESFAKRIHDARMDCPGADEKPQKPGFFTSNGALYATFRPTYPPELARSLAALTAKHDLALDVGCGNGQLTRLLAPHFNQVIGTDVSENQLIHAEPADNLTYLQQAAEAIGLPDHSVDLVVVAQAAHWFDLDRFYREVRRVAGQDAAIALVSYGVPTVAGQVNTVFQRGYWQDIHEFWPPERMHVETGYADLYFPFPRVTFAQHSYRKKMTAEQFIGYITTWSAYENAARNNGQDRFIGFFDKLRSAWRDNDLKEVTWPISIRAARVHQ